MSQAGLLDVESSHPQIPTQFDGNSGSAIPVGNVLNIVTDNSTPIFTGSGSTLTLDFGLSNLALGSELGSINAGVTNSCFGNDAGDALTDGSANVFVGFESGQNATTANDNVFVGYQSGQNATTGSQNIGIGYNSLNLCAEAADNVAIGYNALSSAATLTVNSVVAIGSNACQSLTGGDDTVAVGYQSLVNIVDGSSNVAIGRVTGSSYTTTESFNILIGDGVTGTVGESNVTRIGVNQNACYIDGIDNVNVGSVAKVVTMGSNDQLGTTDLTAGTGITITPGPNLVTFSVDGSVVGQTITGNSGGALSPTAGNWNIVTANSTAAFAGSGSTLTIDFGLSNLAIGSTMPSVTSGTNNCAFGNNALDSITSGSSNVLVGENCGDAISTGSFNVAMGTAALGALSTFSNNTCIGHGSGNALNGASNTCIGYQSLNRATGATNNTCLGYQAGFNYTTTESNNICIGLSTTGTLGESNVTRIGSNQNACYIDGIDGVNVGNVVKVVTLDSDRLGTANITAGTGITVAGTANTITINATGSGLTWSNQGGSTSVTANTGSFSTAAITLTLPASPSIGQICAFVASTSDALVIQAAGTQVINLGNTASSAGGTATSSAKGDVLYLVYQASSDDWFALSSVGIWSLA